MMVLARAMSAPITRVRTPVQIWSLLKPRVCQELVRSITQGLPAYDEVLLGPLPLPCWWSRVVRGWASCCGHDVLPLSLDDPGVLLCGVSSGCG